jgi:hypothetical protein
VKTNENNQSGTTGVADTGVDVRAHAGAAFMRRLMVTPIGVPGPAGDEQLR